MNRQFLMIGLLMLFFPNISVATNNIKEQIIQAEYALYEGDIEPAKRLIVQGSYSLELKRLEILFLTHQEQTDQATKLLDSLQQANPSNAEIFYFAGNIWEDLARQVSFFSKKSYYSRASQAFITAANLAPNNPKFVTAQARAYGQPSILGGAKGKQQQLVFNIQNFDHKFGLYAAMDLAQNEQNYQDLLKIADRAVKAYPKSFLLIARSAQAYRTAGDELNAQQLFLRACLIPKAENQYRLKWEYACFITGYIAENETNNFQIAVTGFKRLLSVYTRPTLHNDQLRYSLAKYLKDIGDLPQAKADFQRLLSHSKFREIQKKAKSELRHFE